MKFCPECGSMLKPKLVHEKKVLACSCGYVDVVSSTIIFSERKSEHKSEHKNTDIVEKSDAPHVIVQEACPKCDNNEAEHWTQQVGPSDEPEANIFKCTKCGYSWRDTHHY